MAVGLAVLLAACSAQEGTTAVQQNPRVIVEKAHVSVAPTPKQRWDDAAGLDPVAAGPRNKFRPESLKSKYPPVKAPALPANVAKVVAPPKPSAKGFRADGTSKELIARRGTHQRTYANPDGTQTTEFSASALNYRKPDGSWASIDSTLVRDPAGGWRRAADSVGLHLADQADAAELVRVTLPGGGVLAYGAAGASAATAAVDGDTATYPKVWPGVDIELQAQPGGVKETLVLASADTPESYVFPLRLTGLTAAIAGEQVVLRDAKGTTVATIPAGFMVDADGTSTSAVRYQLVSHEGEPALRMSVDKKWLAEPGRGFPVRLDPPVLANGAASESLVVQGNDSHGGGDLAVGRRGGENSASYLRFAGLVSALQNQTIFSAQLSLAAFEAPSCKPRALSVHPVTGSWSSSTNTSYPGPAVGSSLGSVSFAQGYVAFGQSVSACPVTGTVIDLGTKGRDLVQGWADGKANNGISLRAPVSDESAWKTIAGTGSANPPRLYVTHSPYNAKYAVPNPTPTPAVLQNQAGKVKITVTNKSAMDWTPSGFQLIYRVYNATTQAKIGQYVAAPLPATVARGATRTLEATIRAMPVGSYLIDFSMATTGGKVFTDEMVPPARIALRVDNIAPVVGELFPPNGYQSPTLTPQLWAQATDLDAPPKQTLQYKFEYCEANSSGNPVNCTTTAYQSKQAFTIPAAKLKWSSTYLWRSFVKDNTTEVTSDYATLITAVPQPEITSRIANAPNGANDREFNPDIGNYTTSSVDAAASTEGPQLNITRSYNSLDPRRDLAFGTGWMSQLDMRSFPETDGSGNVLVTYADGQQVRFGRNPDGTFAAPLGRTAQLSIVSGAYVLKDLAATTYAFRGGDGKIASVVDKNGRRLQFDYNQNTGKVQKIQWRASTTNVAARTLTIGWNAAGTHIASVTTDVVDSTTGAYTWTYQYEGDLLTKVCAPGGQICTTYTYTAGSHYRSSVLDSDPDSYWRLGDKAGATAAGSEMLNNLGKDAGVLRDVTLEQPSAQPGSDDTSGLFNGTTSVAELPKGVVKRSRDSAVELWFKVDPSQLGGPLLGYQDTAVGSTPATGVPLLYVGSDGRVRGQFKTTASTPDPIDGLVDVRDGKWHHVVLSVTADVQSLYLDGVKKGSKPASDGVLDHTLLTFNQAGAAWATNPGTWPAWGSTSAKRHFNGSLDEIATYGHALSDQTVQAHWMHGSAQADLLAKVTLPSGKTASETKYDTGADRVSEYTDGNGGTWKVGVPNVYGDATDLRRAVRVLDPADRAYLYEYDAIVGRLLRSGSPLGVSTRPEDKPLPSPTPSQPAPSPSCTRPDPSYPEFCTEIPEDSTGGPIFVENELTGMVVRSFGYDDAGRQNKIVDENGNVLEMTFDNRGNVTSRKTCRKANDCQTTYTSYTTPNTSNPFDPKNDLPVAVRDPRSSGPTDSNYLSTTAYNVAGDPITETGPESSYNATTYTQGTELGYGSSTDIVPAGLVSTATDAQNKVARYRYTALGDLALETMPTGLVTLNTYDGLGRKISEKVTSDSYPSGVVSEFKYDAFGRQTSVVGPVTTNAVDGTRHQAVTLTEYDVDGNVVRTVLKDALDPDEPERVTTTEYDDFNRPSRTVNPEGHEQTENHDKFGNRTSVVDGNGNRYEYAYTAANKLSEVRLYDFQDEGAPTGDFLVINSYAYDFGGRMSVQVDSMGRRLEYTYLGDDLLEKVVLKKFHNPDGTTRDYVVEENTYDAAGNLTRTISDNGTLTTANTFDRLGRSKSTTVDPGGVNRTTSYDYDVLGNITRSTTSGTAVNVPWPVEATATNVVQNVYNSTTGRLDQERVVSGSSSLITSYTYDQRGYQLTKTDPRGNVSGADKAAYTTTSKYDENGDLTTVIVPAVSVESIGSPAKTVNPTSYTGYNAFGEVVAVKDPLGNISRSKYDRMGLVVEQTGPQYVAPAGPNSSGSAVVKTSYDALGNAVEVTDPKGHVTRTTYDRLNRVVKVDQAGSTDSERLITQFTYTRTGKLRSTVSPTGIRTEATYDDLDRQVTTTVFERKPVARTLTTTTTYDDAGNAVKVTSPTGLVATSTYNKVGDQLSVTDPAGVTTQQGYDGFGNVIRQTDGSGRTTRRDYDGFGNVVAERKLAPNLTELRKETFAYDENGNVTARTNALQKTTTLSYNGLDDLVKQVEPKSATASITTTWGYDAGGNRTRYTDGRGNSTLYGVNSLGLPETVIEPATTAHPAASDRTWTMAYDLNGNATTLVAPGGVTRSRTYDASDRLTAESGNGGGATQVNRGLTYDTEGRLTALTWGGSTANTYTYDDRGNMLTAGGSSGAASFVYDDEGQLTSRTDLSGTANFGYVKGRIISLKDAVSGVSRTIAYDAAGVLKSIDFGAGRVRSYDYDDLGRLTSDTLKNNSGATVTSTTYKYDLDDRVTGKTTTGTAGAGANTYGYDDAGRLNSWTSATGTVDYAYDDAGNRTRAGAKTATYDERNRLLNDSDYTYAYTPRGTMASRTSSGLTDTYSFDAFDRMVAAEGETYVYDGLDRLLNRGGTLFQYAGTDQDPIDDGTERYGRGPGGELLSVSSAAGGTRLTVSDQHDDVVGSFDADSSLTQLDGSTAYDPFGNKIASAGDQANVGYQGDWTDPETGQVNMGARWYEPGTGAFVSRDTVDYKSGASVLANKYTYGAADPMSYNDPTGNWPSCGWCKKAANAVSSGFQKAVNYVAPYVSYAWHASGASWLWDQGRAAVSAIKRGWDSAVAATKSYIKKKANSIRETWNNRVMPTLNNWKESAKQKAQELRAAARAVTNQAKAQISAAVKSSPLKNLGSIVKAKLKSSLKIVISAVVPPKLVQTFSAVVQDLNGAAKALYNTAQAAGRGLIAGASAAADWVVDHKADIIGGIAGAAVGIGCGIAIGWTGVGAIGCAALAGAAGSLVTDLVEGGKGWKEMAANALMGAVIGGVTGPLSTIGGSALSGAARGFIQGGAKKALSTGVTSLVNTTRSFGNTQVGGLVGKALANKAAGNAGREAVESTGAGASRGGGRPASKGGCTPSPAPNSFAAGTAVLMAGGGSKPIENVVVGDRVLATDPTTGRTEPKAVTALIVGVGEKQMVELTVDTDGDKGSKTATIDATQGHPFWSPDLNRWVDAGDLKNGSLLQTGAGTYVQVNGARKYTLPQTQVHNLTVDGIHTYYVVTGNQPVLVHNIDPAHCTLPDPANANVPRHSQRKTAATSDGGATWQLSGWSQRMPKAFTRVSTTVTAKLRAKFGLSPRTNGNDQGVPGRYYDSHAEVQSHAQNPHGDVVVTRDPCGSCQEFFTGAAVEQQRSIPVSSPSGISVFHPTGDMEFLPR